MHLSFSMIVLSFTFQLGLCCLCFAACHFVVLGYGNWLERVTDMHMWLMKFLCSGTDMVFVSWSSVRGLSSDVCKALCINWA